MRTPGTSIMAPARRRISHMARAAATAATVASAVLSGLTSPCSRSPHRARDVTNLLGAQSRAHLPSSVAAAALEARSPPPRGSHARSTCATNRSSASELSSMASRSARDAASCASMASAAVRQKASSARTAASDAAGSASLAAVSWPGSARRMRALAARLFTCADASIACALLLCRRRGGGGSSLQRSRRGGQHLLALRADPQTGF